MDRPAVAELMADVSAALAERVSVLCEDVYEVILREIQQLRGWLQVMLADLATDDEHQARLRDTLRVSLASGGSYKTTAGQLMLHKNTVRYRIRKAEESLGRPPDQNRLGVELALLASHWLSPAVLRPPAGDRRDD